jgi:aspartokinase/homoserine dehydrogenase 1
MRVMKFGGSSVRDADHMRRVADLILHQNGSEPVVVVCSAMKGITDLLIDGARLAEAGDGAYHDRVAAIRARHEQATALLIDDPASSVYLDVPALLDELSGLLHGVELVRECTLRTYDLIMSFGERLSCTILAASLEHRGCPAHFVDARSLIVTDESHGNANVQFPESYSRIQDVLADTERLPVITGFIASTPTGVTTTLGRNGSDYTASILGAGLAASQIEIWTDVDGVMSADPRYVPGAFVIPEISFQEAMELSYFGAEVIHPYTMIPAIEKDVPVLIKNTMNPSVAGTRIARDAASSKRPITGIASIERVALVNVEGGGMVGLPSVSYRIFQALAVAQVNIVMISQASSEHSVCIVCREEEAPRAVKELNRELEREIASKVIQRVDFQPGLEIVAIIGENMRGIPGISGRLFQSIGEEGINVLAIAQGSSERNISFVIDMQDRRRALNVIHREFLE